MSLFNPDTLTLREMAGLLRRGVLIVRPHVLDLDLRRRRGARHGGRVGRIRARRAGRSAATAAERHLPALRRERRRDQEREELRFIGELHALLAVGDRAEQPVGVGVLRVGEQLVDLGLLEPATGALIRSLRSRSPIRTEDRAPRPPARRASARPLPAWPPPGARRPAAP